MNPPDDPVRHQGAQQRLDPLEAAAWTAAPHDALRQQRGGAVSVEHPR